MIEAKDLRYIQCPRCGSDILHKHGTYRGFQRFICCECNKTFTSYSSTIINRTRYDDPDWLDFIKLLCKNMSVRKISEEIGIHYLTANSWKHKVLEALRDNHPNLDDFNKENSIYCFHSHVLFQNNIELVTLKNSNKLHTYIIDKSKKNELISSIEPYQIVNKDKMLTIKNYNEHYEFYIHNLIKNLKKQKRLKYEYIQPYINLYDISFNYAEQAVDIIYQYLLSK